MQFRPFLFAVQRLIWSPGGRRVRGTRLRPHAAEPAGATVLVDRHVGKAGVRELCALLVYRPRGNPDCGRQPVRVRRVLATPVELDYEHEPPAGLQHAEHLAHASHDVAPPEVSFDTCHEVEGIRLERERLHGRLPHLDAALLHERAVRARRRGHARVGVVHAEDLAARSRGELANRPPSAAPDVEDRVVRTDRNVPEAPIRELRVVAVHPPEHAAAHEPGGLGELARRETQD